MAIFQQENCDFKGHDIDEVPSNSIFDCFSPCTKNNNNCTHYSYQNGTCYLKNAPAQTDRVSTESGACGYYPDRLHAKVNGWNIDDKQGFFNWKNDCDFGLNYVIHDNAYITSAHDCGMMC